ncbi:MAG: hypothetical protein HYR85_12460 [Planctomycetes bacterium]|nr:hypothetical protein [Planctomycetota bacterium]
MNLQMRGGGQFQVLNFGISGFGVGQCLLTFEQHASRYAPDTVFVFVAGMHFARTIDRYAAAGPFTGRSSHLWIRPTFRLDDGVLVREPAADYDAFVKLQDDVIRTKMGGSRVCLRKRKLFVLSFAADLWKRLRTYQRKTEIENLADATIDLNLAILAELGRQTKRAGARLAIVDASRYFSRASRLPEILERFAGAHDFGYVALSSDLLAANAKGIATCWPHDTHFNEAANEIFAEAMHRWISSQ